MSTTDTRTATEINAATGAARVAQASAIARESNAPKSTPAPRKRASAATRKSAATAKTAPASKTATPKTATPKPAPAVKTPKITGPSDRELKRVVAQAAMNAAVDAFMKLPRKTVDGETFVMIAKQPVPESVATYAVKQVFGYVPPTVWDSRLGVRDVGRPVAAPKSAAA